MLEHVLGFHARSSRLENYSRSLDVRHFRMLLSGIQARESGPSIKIFGELLVATV